MMQPKETNQILGEKLEERIQQGLFQGKKTVIFGCTSMAPGIIDHLRSREVRVACCVDNSEAKVGKQLRGLPICRPEDYLKPHRNNVVILIPPTIYRREMALQVKEMGYSEQEIIQLEDLKKLYDDSVEALEQQLQIVAQGVEVYERLRGNSDKMVFFFLWLGMGDIYLACAFLREYLERERIDDYVITMTRPNFVQVVEMLGLGNIIVLSQEETDALMAAWQFLGEEQIHAKPLTYDGWSAKKLFTNRKLHGGFTFTDYVKFDIFGLEEDSRPRRPRKRPNDAYCKALFDQLGLRKGRTVILAPYAGSFLPGVKESDWEQAASILRKKGYDVCTNCYGQEEPIPGTCKIQFPLLEAINAAEYAGGVISIRSGLCDVLSSAECELTVIYEDGFGDADYDFYSLEKMGLRDRVNEIVYNGPSSFLETIGRLY